MEKSDVSTFKSLDHLSQQIETPTIELNLAGKGVISRYIEDFDNRYVKLHWLANYLQDIINLINSNTKRISLDLNYPSQEVLISEDGISKIIYCLQTKAITPEELTFKTETYKLQGIKCRWFFSGKAENETSCFWACKQLGGYCYLERHNNSAIINVYKWNPYDNVPIPIDYIGDRVIIQNALDYH